MLYYYIFMRRLSLASLLLATGPAAAQALTATGLLPLANSTTAAPGQPIVVTFSQPLTASSGPALNVFSSQRGGLRTRGANLAEVSANALRYTPQPYSFAAGETVQYTVTPAASSSSGTLAKPLVSQFTVATQGNGTSRFGTSTTSASGYSPNAISAADLDADGDLDLLIANATDAVTVALNDGHGSFSFSHQVPASQPVSLSVGDLDGDGDLDFVAAVDYRTPTVSVFFNNGNATFTEQPALSPGFVAGSTALGDVDGDGDLDLLAATRSYTGRVAVFRNGGSGIFTAGPSFAVGYYPRPLTLGDLDNDGDLDCAVVNQGSVTNGIYPSSSLCFNDGTGTFTAVTDYFLLGYDPYALALGDVDGDRDLDIVVVNNHYATYSYGTMGICLNDGHGKFASKQGLSLPSTPSSVTLGDIDGDHDLDFVVTIGGWASGAGTFYERTACVGLNNGTGTFALGQTVGASTLPSAVTLADLDGDRDLDMAVANLMGNSYSVSLNESAVALAGQPRQTALSFSLAPNPAQERAELVGASPHAAIELLDVRGRLVVRTTADAAGAAHLSWPNGLAGGVYIVRAGEQSRRLLIAE